MTRRSAVLVIEGIRAGRDLRGIDEGEASTRRVPDDGRRSFRGVERIVIAERTTTLPGSVPPWLTPNTR